MEEVHKFSGQVQETKISIIDVQLDFIFENCILKCFY